MIAIQDQPHESRRSETLLHLTIASDSRVSRMLQQIRASNDRLHIT